MTLNLVKLCVGVDSVEDLKAWADFRRDEARAQGIDFERTHTTRMVPTRRDELLDGGSLYWVIKGKIQVRQRLVDIRPFKDEAGIKRCDLVLEPKLVLTRMQPRRPFQGWRYLTSDDAPPDIRKSTGDDEMPIEMQRELAKLGLL
ncbi:DUF1489 family protein [Breoghania sp. L-A4]|uniref:DUF1489 family protein n=1 Tax=Breoghania sp. L-A4 TaxID=2304600 RepID=UPI000E35A111|nr:DUF1489 family protein [Breoghania sp. L-A4]AXS42614.1 DUF1489 family protein [Breoghania sp. L-A4]